MTVGICQCLIARGICVGTLQKGEWSLFLSSPDLAQLPCENLTFMEEYEMTFDGREEIWAHIK